MENLFSNWVWNFLGLKYAKARSILCVFLIKALLTVFGKIDKSSLVKKWVKTPLKTHIGYALEIRKLKRTVFFWLGGGGIVRFFTCRRSRAKFLRKEWWRQSLTIIKQMVYFCYHQDEFKSFFNNVLWYRVFEQFHSFFQVMHTI